MPELPEVETVARGLQAQLPGRRIVEVRFGKTDFVVNPAAIEEHLRGQRIGGVRRFGKFLLVECEAVAEEKATKGAEEKDALLVHLGMTGQLTIAAAGAPVAPHTHAFFALDDGREMRYTDVRRFGRMELLRNGGRERALGALGLDPLEASEREFSERIGGRHARVKALLLDQHVLRGVGNIYADESLWRAKIHPMRTGNSLGREEMRRLYGALQATLREAIRLRGSSVSDYVDAEGARGEFQLRHRVYQREGKKCFRCGATIHRAIVAGRSSHFCPRCQRAPRRRRIRSKN
ncbi:MAG TPA: bifunctional DNA-formamidopyrimidine glycosylase/DNA-(apurinic or apyrimidinic site) lyase [Verrucomicrobiae bacterium]|nr:bifunctional DNA-formamidopyrimidine glycosylase/DNA-(apurinic or apyrimidinic site) lyase [Verrucomicrobiae bacterium]